MKQKVKRTYKGLSKRTRSLLRRQEGLDVEFKRCVQGVDQVDLVGFANSPQGGSILIGVDEVAKSRAPQRGVVVGCEVGDREKQLLHNKATDCVPPVRLEVFIENVSTRKPIFRVEIPESAHKPHCTRRGTYKIRGDGRSNALLPRSLLAIFMEAEGDQFLRRFKRATEQMRSDVESDYAQLLADLRTIEQRLVGVLGKTVEARRGAAGEGEEVVDLVAATNSKVATLESGQRDTREKLDLLLAHFELEDALQARRHQRVALFVSLLLMNDRSLPADRVLRALRRNFPEIRVEALNRWVVEFFDELGARSSD